MRVDKFVNDVRWAAERVRQQTADAEPLVVVGRCADGEDGEDVAVRSVTYVGNVVRIVVDR